MAIPEKCTVLVVGGGPAGSYAAAVLAREGIDTVVLEADVFPRYHIGESMLPSLRYYLQFIDLDEQYLNHGFVKKIGAAFKMSPNHREGFTDFLAADGAGLHTWNVIRSEADELMLRHAAKSGAQVFEGIKVSSVHNGVNGHSNDVNGAGLPNPGRPVSASYTRKADGMTGVIKFDYIIDASGRAGVLNTKYQKNRHYDPVLKNIANWGYWRNTGRYAAGTPRENTPLSEALNDESGWAWFIPLHDGTTSVGIVRHQDKFNKEKKAASSPQDFYLSSLKLAPMITDLISNAELVSPQLKSASDFSYHSSTYAFPYARVIGDAGAFIDPFFSSGVHLAVTGALSAATTIAASIKGDCDEGTAALWHSNKVREGYARFLVVVLSAYKQMRNQDAFVLSDFGEDNFDRAFSFFKPIIQGTADATSKFTQAEFSGTIDFVSKALTQEVQESEHVTQDPKKETMEMGGKINGSSEEEQNAFRALRETHGQNILNINSFTTDIIDGRVPRLETGALTLVNVE
ncbi:radH flavin-dependent halogenase [Thozetella sp. PMI_491]|nr:radH flavin-dependent halogenase [Thozetella sp. PMI_491]